MLQECGDLYRIGQVIWAQVVLANEVLWKPQGNPSVRRCWSPPPTCPDANTLMLLPKACWPERLKRAWIEDAKAELDEAS